MLEIRDTDTGLSLSLDKDPGPRNPRLALDPVFQVVTWTPNLGDAHAWPDAAALLAEIRPDRAALFPLRVLPTTDGPILVRMRSGEGPVAGYAFATFERLCIAFGLDEIANEIRNDVLAEAEALCLVELLDHEHFVRGQAYCYEIVDRRGRVLEARRDLYGEDYACHVAHEAFDRRMKTVHAGG